MEARQIRGYSILAKGVEPKEVGINTYKIPSQSQRGNYMVEHKGRYQRWTCSCPDFQYRGLKCKHIYAVEFWLNLKEDIVQEVARTVVPKPEVRLACPFCKSENVVKKGKRKCKNMIKQRFLCRDCGKRFIDDKEFEKIKATPEMVTAVLDLYLRGISLRKISDHLSQIYRIKVGKSTIHRWIMTYMDKINDYVECLTPEVGGMWHTDEMAVKINGEWEWLWNTIDHSTKFMLANNITPERYSKDAQQVFSKAKKIAKKNPHVVVTDGLQGYKQAFRDEFQTFRNRKFPMHIANVGINNKHTNNNVVERYHGTVRERDKTMRGLKTERTAEIIHNGVKDYYNFVRPHQGLEGKTPAEMAGIEMELEQNRWMGLLRHSIRHSQERELVTIGCSPCKR